jgi:hypothetical protein
MATGSSGVDLFPAAEREPCTPRTIERPIVG